MISTYLTSPHLTALDQTMQAMRAPGAELEQRSKIGLCGLFMVQVSKHLKLIYWFTPLSIIYYYWKIDSGYCISLQYFLLKFSILNKNPGQPRISIDINEGKKCHSYSGLYSQCVVYHIKFMSPRYEFSPIVIIVCRNDQYYCHK